MHGDERQILLGRHDAAADERQVRGRPDEMKAHQQREHDSDRHGSERKEKILKADDFVVRAENIAADEALFGVRGGAIERAMLVAGALTGRPPVA